MLAANETSNGNEIMRVELSSVTLKQPRWRNTSIVIQTPDGKVTYTLRTLLVVFGLVGFILLRRKTKALGAFVMQAQSMQAAR